MNNGIYEKLDVHLTDRGESFYQPYMVKIVEWLREQNYVRIKFRTCCTCKVNGIV